MSRSVAQPSVVTRSGTAPLVAVSRPVRTNHVAMPAVLRYDDGTAQTAVTRPPKAG